MKYDLAIIGGGGAAFAAAAKANDLGAKAVLLNKGLPLGGTCVNVGCVPSKFLLELGFDRWRAMHPRFGSVKAAEPQLDFESAIAEKEHVILRNRKAKYAEVLAGYKNVELIEERGRFEGPGRLRADNRLIEAEHVLIATGSSNQLVPITGLEQLPPGDVLDNVSAFKLKHLPKSMLVLGGGPTGLEVAQIFAHFGTKVTLFEAKDRVFSVTEPEVSGAIEDAFRKDGIEVHTKAKATAVRKEGSEIVLTAEADGKRAEYRAERLFMAVGVVGNTRDLNLSAIGLKPGPKDFLEVDDYYQTKARNVWAAGDVAGPPLLETLAAREGAHAVDNALNGKKLTINYDAVPAVIFTEPQVATVGLTEEQSMQRFGSCDCRSVALKFVPKADIANQKDGVAKMAINPKNGKIVGFHVVAPCAAEMIHEAALAIQHGLTTEDIINLVHVFPTYSEAIKLSAQAFKRDVEHMSCCVE